ncbi:MAG: hypothetical protein Q4D14_08015 [Bacteroidales bacterium]|nr:hypothetical protein [Bacteroidales bacterium]
MTIYWLQPSNDSFRIAYKTKETAAAFPFLPAAGYRNGTTVNNVGSNGNYWSSTYNSSNNAYNLNFNASNLNAQNNNNNNRYNGKSVRLVRLVQPLPVITFPHYFFFDVIHINS